MPLVFGLLLGLTALLAPAGVLAWPGKLASCTACHNAHDPDAVSQVYINGAANSSITVPNDGSGSFEIDFFFQNATDIATFEGIGVEVNLPAGWALAPGTSTYSPGGWRSAWDGADGIGWSGPYDTGDQFPAAPAGYTVNYAGSAWDIGSRDAACDRGAVCSSGIDLDGLAETIGADALITVPAGTAPGVYTIELVAAGHHNGVRAHDGATVSVTVTGDVTSALGEVSPNSVVAWSAGNALAYDILPTITGISTGVNRVELTAPAAFSAFTVTGVSVGGAPLSANCPNPGAGQYCATVAAPVMTINLGTKVTTSLSNIRVQFSANAPGSLGSYAFRATVDDTTTGRPPVQVAVGNADGDAGDANSEFVAVTGTTLTWVGGVSTDFTNPNNWSPALAPSSAYDCVVNGYTTFQPRIGTNTSCGSLTLGTGGSLVSLTFFGSNNLTVPGNVVIGSNGRLAPAGTPSGIFTIGGNWSDTLGVTNFTSPDLRLQFYFDGYSNPIHSDETFYDVRIRGNIALQTDLDIANSFLIDSSGRFTQGANTLNIYGNSLNLSGAYNFTCSSILNLFGSLSLESNRHYPTTVVKSGASITGSNPAFIDCDLTLEAGATFDTGTNLHVEGDWINDGATVLLGSGRVHMVGPASQIRGSSASTFYDLTIGDHPGDATASPFDLVIQHDLEINPGATFTLADSRNISIGRNALVEGTANVSGTTTWSQGVGNNTGLVIASGGLLSARGSDAANRVTFTRNGVGFYEIEARGGLDLRRVNIRYTQSATANNGFTIHTPAWEPLFLEDVALALTEDINGATMMYWNSSRTLTASGFTFDSATYIANDTNVHAAAGTINFVAYGGNFAGEALDNDSGGFANWLSFQPDAALKLATEGGAAYLSDDTYEAPPITQIKYQGALSGATASYHIKIQNDGDALDSFLVSGTGSGSGFTVQYLDQSAIDRTAAVTGGGYTTANLAPAAEIVWTVNLTLDGNPTPVPGGSDYPVTISVTSVGDPTSTDQVRAVTTSTSAHLSLLKNVDKATADPGEDLTYTTLASNGGGLSPAAGIVLEDAIPTNTVFKLGGATFAAQTSTLAASIVYSDDNGGSWTYTPVSGGCGAAGGYDACVTDVRWSMTGSMPSGTQFSIEMTVQVK